MCGTAPKALSRPMARLTVDQERVNSPAPQLFPGNNRLGAIPRATDWRGLSQTSVATSTGSTTAGRDWRGLYPPSITDNLTITRRNHNYKAGFYLERIRNGDAGGNWSGSFNFRSDESNYTAALGNTGNPMRTRSLVVSAVTVSRPRARTPTWRCLCNGTCRISGKPSGG